MEKNKYVGYVPKKTEDKILDNQEVTKSKKTSKLENSLIAGILLSAVGTISALGFYNLGLNEIDKGRFPKGINIHPVFIGLSVPVEKTINFLNGQYSKTKKSFEYAKEVARNIKYDISPDNNCL